MLFSKLTCASNKRKRGEGGCAGSRGKNFRECAKVFERGEGINYYLERENSGDILSLKFQRS